MNLNAKQLEAIKDTEGAVLVLAGAGSGKTRVLTARICYLIEQGVDPYSILAITFTNKAASEMKERISSALSNNLGSLVWTSTFHSMCAKILRLNAGKIGYSTDFSIYTEVEAERVVKRVLQNVTNANPKSSKLYTWHISTAKTYDLDPDAYFNEIKRQAKDADIVCNIYRLYQAELKRSNAMDFDDLLVNTLRLFESSSDVLEHYSKRFRYILVDEFQDTNSLQYRIVKFLSSFHNNLFAVGDEDQSIYSWRGADIGNILNFSKDFKGAKVHKLEQNYRSTMSILRTANNVIKNNTERNEKTLWSEIEGEDSVEYFEANTDREEASFVARQINYLISTGQNFKDMAVLVRANALTRTFEEVFNLHAMPYKVFGGFKFFERKEIKDTLSYAKIAVNPRDNDSILRVINYPKRGIGLVPIEELVEVASRNDLSFFEALNRLDLFSVQTSKKLAPFADICNALVSKVASLDPDDFIEFMFDVSGIEREFKKNDDPETVNRYENIKELQNAVCQFAKDNPDLTIANFLESVALVSDTDDITDGNYISIGTVHAVKGLEFDNVFIVGLEEGIFPNARASEKNTIEEERRLMYVAITRAKKKCFAISSKSRFRFGKTEYLPKSRFIAEMRGGKGAVKNISAFSFGDNSVTAKTVGSEQNKSKSIGMSPSQIGGGMNPKFNSSVAGSAKKLDFSAFKKDVLVEHTKFGTGFIISTEQKGDDVVAAIAFKGLGVKRFSLSIAHNMLKIKDNKTD